MASPLLRRGGNVRQRDSNARPPRTRSSSRPALPALPSPLHSSPFTVAVYDGIYYQREMPALCKEWTFKAGESFTIVGFMEEALPPSAMPFARREKMHLFTRNLIGTMSMGMYAMSMSISMSMSMSMPMYAMYVACVAWEAFPLSQPHQCLFRTQLKTDARGNCPS